MKQNNKFSRFRKNDMPEKNIICSCGARAKLKSHKNYPHGRKSKAVKSQYYKCEKCGKISFLIEKQNGGRK